MQFTQHYQQRYPHGWIRTGQDKVIETTGNRSRLNIIGALEPVGYWCNHCSRL
ncbi:hypothetical protein VAE151_630523 [Vibrio aestuarianus]|nr:hypothetical protein VAE055_420524 [Vibrio aestuarianus]CAH8226105.1 hypothetical protein VAE128_500517 [Vibrio aestuarianus]CAH8237070.1 hypothetical protein VAE151_630523 [Vibrio aestuarianus]